MTVDEFKDSIDSGRTIMCRNISERNAVLEFLIFLGYELNEPSAMYLKPGNEDDAYLHPAKSRYGSVICCRMCADDGSDSVIPFCEVSSLLDYMDSGIDERTQEEFEQEFAALMCRKDGNYDA